MNPNPPPPMRGAREIRGTSTTGGTPVSVGGALGLTPARPKGRNLAGAKAASAADEVDAARLDELNAGNQRSARKKRKNSKSRKVKRRKQSSTTVGWAEGSYQAKSRESLSLFQQTSEILEEEEEEKTGAWEVGTPLTW